MLICIIKQLDYLKDIPQIQDKVLAAHLWSWEGGKGCNYLRNQSLLEY